MNRHEQDEWLSLMDQLGAIGWCHIPGWKLRLWFDRERITKQLWAEIVRYVELNLGKDSKVLALYNEKHSTDALILKMDMFNFHSSAKNSAVVEQLRAWSEDLKG